MDNFTHEHLLAEYERRHGQLAWFHDQSDTIEAMRHELQEAITLSPEVAAEEFVPLAQAILHNNFTPVEQFIKSRRPHMHPLQAITSSFARAGW